MTTIFLVAAEQEARGEYILGELLHSPVPLGDTAGVSYPASADEARADVAARLDAVDGEWRRFVSLL